MSYPLWTEFTKQKLFYLLIAHIPTFKDYMCITKEYRFIDIWRTHFIVITQIIMCGFW